MDHPRARGHLRKLRQPPVRHGMRSHSMGDARHQGTAGAHLEELCDRLLVPRVEGIQAGQLNGRQLQRRQLQCGRRDAGHNPGSKGLGLLKELLGGSGAVVGLLRPPERLISEGVHQGLELMAAKNAPDKLDARARWDGTRHLFVNQ